MRMILPRFQSPRESRTSYAFAAEKVMPTRSMLFKNAQKVQEEAQTTKLKSNSKVILQEMAQSRMRVT